MATHKRVIVESKELYLYSRVTGQAELAQLVERTTLNRVVEGSIPSFGVLLLHTRSHITFLYLSLHKTHLRIPFLIFVSNGREGAKYSILDFESSGYSIFHFHKTQRDPTRPDPTLFHTTKNDIVHKQGSSDPRIS